MSKVKFFNEDCMTTMNNMLEFNQKIDLILTSPPYNTGRPSEPLFNTWHTDRYLAQCLYNLEEKYDRGGISQEEWDKIYNKYFNKCIEVKW